MVKIFSITPIKKPKKRRFIFNFTNGFTNGKAPALRARAAFVEFCHFVFGVEPIFFGKFQENSGDFDDLLLIGFDKTHPEDQNHLDRMVHFFLYDYRFERVWKNPDSDIEKLS